MDSTLLYLGIGAAALMLGGKKKAPATDGHTVVIGDHFKPASITKGKTYTIQNYRVLGSRRPNLQYVPVSDGTVGSDLTFVAPASGQATRNVTQEAGQTYIEVAA